VREKTEDIPAARPARAFSWFQVGLGAATASLLIGLVALQNMGRANERHTLMQLADNHARSLLAGHLADVSSADFHIVKPWFEGKINFAPPVPDLTVAGYKLVGGRLDYVAGHTAAALVYQLGKHDISVFVWPEPGSPAHPPQIMTAQRGYQIVGWQSGELACRAISDLSERDLRDFASAFQANAQNR
jgi:anti-sigma factor RsiW